MPGLSWRWWRRGVGEGVLVEEDPARPIDSRIMPGVPDAFTGEPWTTYGQMRRMAEEIRDVSWRTPVEKGLAIGMLAIIEDLERVLMREGGDEEDG